MYTCSICGYDKLIYPLWDEKEGFPTHNACICCGFESGFDDDDIGMTIDEFRNGWIKLGSPWFSSTIPQPKDWNWKKQLKNIGIELDR